MDGGYVICADRVAFERTLRATMECLVAVFLHEEDQSHRFLVRGGIAAGRVVLGDVLAKCSKHFNEEARYASCIAIGSAIGQAYLAEQRAPPFGYWVDITARSFESNVGPPFLTAFWRWWVETGCEVGKCELIRRELSDHFAWARRNWHALEYSLDRIEEHWAVSQEYFQPSAT